MDRPREILQCKCGGRPRIRYKDPYVWVECRNKCGERTGYHSNGVDYCTLEAENEAIAEWNRMVRDG